MLTNLLPLFPQEIFLLDFEERNQTSEAILNKHPYRGAYKVLEKLPFSSSRKMSAVKFEELGTYVVGAPEFVLSSEHEVVKQLEGDTVSLEDSFRLYQQGMELLKACNDKIDLVEKKMLVLDENGEQCEPFANSIKEAIEKYNWTALTGEIDI